jgi:hypothetical protein
MSQIIIQPAGGSESRQHFLDTVERPVSLDTLARFLPAADIKSLLAIYGSQPIPTWELPLATEGTAAPSGNESIQETLCCSRGRARSTLLAYLRTGPMIRPRPPPLGRERDRWTYMGMAVLLGSNHSTLDPLFSTGCRTWLRPNLRISASSSY